MSAVTQERERTASAASLEQLLKDEMPRVYSLAYRLLSNQADAEEVTQEVWLQVLRKWETFRGDAAPSTWLHRVAVNAALAYRRARATRQGHHTSSPLEGLNEETFSHHGIRKWSLTPAQQLLNQETRKLIEHAIAGLPEVYREVYVLADLEGLTNQEIADLLGASLAAVKSRLHRARLLMRDALAPHFEETHS